MSVGSEVGYLAGRLARGEGDDGGESDSDDSETLWARTLVLFRFLDERADSISSSSATTIAAAATAVITSINAMHVYVATINL
jgi:hypothetical protein